MVFFHVIDRQSGTLKPSSNAAWAWRIGITVDHILPSRTLAARNCWSRPLSGSGPDPAGLEPVESGSGPAGLHFAQVRPQSSPAGLEKPGSGAPLAITSFDSKI
jgi:hypothetical protein